MLGTESEVPAVDVMGVSGICPDIFADVHRRLERTKWEKR